MKPVPEKGLSGLFQQVIFQLPAILTLASLVGLSFSLLNYLPRTSVTTGRLLLHIMIPGVGALTGWLLTVDPFQRVWARLLKIYPGKEETLPQHAWTKRLKIANFYAMYVTIFSAFIALKTILAGLDYIRIYNDTATYAAFAAKPLTDFAFWAGRVPFTFPLIFKFLGSSSYVSGEFFQSRNPLSNFQVIFSIFSWGILTFSFSLVLKKHWLKLTAFGIILFFSASMDISLWDRILLSESLTHSLFALLVSLWIFGAILINAHPSFLITGFYLAALLIITVLFSFIRDTNSYLLLATTFFLSAGLFFKNLRQKPIFPVYIGYILLIMLIFVLENKSSDLGRRWQTPFLNVLIERVYQQPDMLNYFVENGMPQKDALLTAQRSLPSASYHDLVSYDHQFAPLQTWSETRGKNIFTRYLLSRPFNSLVEPLLNYQLLLNGVNNEYRQPRQPDPEWVSKFSALLYYHSPFTLITSFGLLLGTLLVLIRQKATNLYILIPAALMLLCYPLMFVVWHGDAGEIERHSALIGICFRLSTWMMIFWLLDNNLRMVAKADQLPKR